MKPVQAKPRIEQMHLFPPLKSGGLIEAASGASRTVSNRRFPPLKSGGLIEARRRAFLAAQKQDRFLR